MRIESASFTFPWASIPQGKGVQKTEKKYKDLKSLYRLEDTSIHPDTVLYEVVTLPEEEKVGKLLWGVSIVHPIQIQGECNMTRGHYHANRDCQEYYWCMQGQGMLVLMDEKGDCRIEEVKSGSLHKIEGHVAHRLINTGSCDLMVVACWPAQSGHDYKSIENHNFPIRVFKRKDNVYVEEI